MGSHANTVTTSALGMAFWVLAGRLYSEAQVRESAAIISGMMLLSVVYQLNLAMGITRLLPQVAGRRWQPALSAYGLTAVVTMGGLEVAAPGLSGGFAFLRQSPALKLSIVVAVALWNIIASLPDAVLTSAGRAALLLPARAD